MENTTTQNTIKIADGYIAKEGDIVTDLGSNQNLTGKLRWSVLSWLIEWDDGITTFIYDPTQLRIFKP